MVAASGNFVTIPLTNIANAQTITVTLSNVSGSTNVTIPMRLLIGDINGNGAVNASDLASSKSLVGQSRISDHLPRRRERGRQPSTPRM